MPARRQYKKQNETDRARALGCLDADMGSRKVPKRFQTSHHAINRIKQRYRQIELFKDRLRSGRPRVTTRAEDRCVTNVIARNRFVTWPETRRRLYAAKGPGSRPVSVQTVRNRIHAGGIKLRVVAKEPELSQRLKNARNAFSRAHVGEKGYVLRRVTVLTEVSGRQETSLETKQRETCSRHSNPDSSLLRWWSHGVGRGFSDCKDRPGLHRKKPECTTLHQRNPYATCASVAAPDASRQYNFPGWQRQASSSAHCRQLPEYEQREQNGLTRDVSPFIM